LNNSQIRTGRFLFDELFGIDIIDSTETDEESLRNCTCGKNYNLEPICKQLSPKTYLLW